MWAKTAAMVLAIASVAGAQSDEQKQKEEEAKAKIGQFKKELKSAKSDKDVARAIEGLGELQHPRVLVELRSYLSRTPEVLIAAAEQIGKYKKDKDAAEALMAATSGMKDKDCMVHCIRYAGDTEYKGIIPKLTALFRNKDVGTAHEAVDSCGKIRCRDAMDPLLNLWKELDAIQDPKTVQGGGGGFGGLGGLNSGTQDDPVKRKNELSPAIVNAIKKITGEDFKDLRAANDWWRRNKATFKDPE